MKHKKKIGFFVMMLALAALTACGKESGKKENKEITLSPAATPTAEPTSTVAPTKAADSTKTFQPDFEVVKRTAEVGTEWKTWDGYKATAYPNFNIEVASGDIYLSDDLAEQLENIISVCEEVTGYKLNPKELSYLPGREEYPTFRFSHRKPGYIESCSGDLISLFEEEASVGTLSDNYGTLVHETLHSIQDRNCYMRSAIFVEGFAEYYTEKVLEVLEARYGYKYFQNEHKDHVLSMTAYGENECGLDFEFTEKRVPIDMIEEYFFRNPAHGGHEPSYYIVSYFIEKYGEAELKNVFKKIETLSLSKYQGEYKLPEASSEEVLNLLKKDYSENFVEEFYEWFLTQDFKTRDMPDYDFTGKGEQKGTFSMLCTAEDEVPYLNSVGNVKFTDSFTLDFTDAIRLAEKKMQMEYRGIEFVVLGNVTVTFFDEEGKQILKQKVSEEAKFEQTKVYKIEVLANGESEVFLYCVNPEEQFCVNYRWDRQTQQKITGNSIPIGSEVILNASERYIIDGFLNVFGTLETEENGIIFDGGWIWLGNRLGETSVWKRGEQLLRVSAVDGYALSGFDYGPEFRISEENDILVIEAGKYAKLEITLPKGQKFEDYFRINEMELREGAQIYVNGERIL